MILHEVITMEEGEMESGNFLTKEESIELAKKLSGLYSELAIKTKTINGLKEEINRIPNHSDNVRYSAFRFFWKYLVIAAVSEVVIYVLGMFVVATLITTDAGTAITVIWLLLVILTIPVVLIYGAIKSRKERDFCNAQLEESARMDWNKKTECEKELRSNETELNDYMQKIAEYDDIVPSHMRQKTWMEKICKLLEAGQAESFTEAVAMLNKKTGTR